MTKPITHRTEKARLFIKQLRKRGRMPDHGTIESKIQNATIGRQHVQSQNAGWFGGQRITTGGGVKTIR